LYGTTGEEREGIQSGIVKDLEELLERKKSWKNVLQVSLSKEGERELEGFRFAFTYPQKFFFICSLWSISEVGLPAVFRSLLRSRRETYLISSGEAWLCFKNFKLDFNDRLGMSLYFLISS